LIAVTIVALAVLGYGAYGLRVQPGTMSVAVTPAAQAIEQFEALRASVDEGSFTGRVFVGEALSNPEEYVFVTYTLRVKNVGFIPAEWIELAVTPAGGDVLELDRDGAQALSAMSEGDLKAVVLQKGDGSDAQRAAQVTYYAFGRPYVIDVEP
jgi:hypothetical protein